MNRARAKTYIGRTLIVLGGIGLVTHPLFMALTAMAYAKAPSVPDRASGHIYPMINHGFVHYLDANAQRIFDVWPWSVGIGITLFLAGILLLQGKRIVADYKWRAISRDF